MIGQSKKLWIILIAVLTLAISISEARCIGSCNLQLIISKTEAAINESVLLVALAHFTNLNNLAVYEILIYEDGRVIKKCEFGNPLAGSDRFFCYEFVRCDRECSRNYYAEIRYEYIVDPILRSNTVTLKCVQPKDAVNYYLVNISSTLVDVNRTLSFIVDVLREINYSQQINNQTLRNIINLLNIIISRIDKIDRNVEEILKILGEISRNQKLELDTLNRIVSMLERLTSISLNNTEMLKRVLEVVTEISRNQKLELDTLSRIVSMLERLTSNDALISNQLDRIIGIVNIILRNSESSIDLTNRVLAIVRKIESRLGEVERNIIRELDRVKIETIVLIDSIIKQAIIDEREKYCLTFESTENRVTEDGRVVIYLRNCGTDTLFNITVLLRYKENFAMRLVSFIYPNEVKVVQFNTDLSIGERVLATVYAFNDKVGMKYDFFLERVGYLPTLKIDVLDSILTENKWREVYVRIRNLDVKPLKDLPIAIETPNGVMYSIENNKISLAPLQSKTLKIRFFVSEAFEDETAKIKITVGEQEKIIELKVEKAIAAEKDNKDKRWFELGIEEWIKKIVWSLIVVILIIVILLLLKYYKTIGIKKEIELP